MRCRCVSTLILLALFICGCSAGLEASNADPKPVSGLCLKILPADARDVGCAGTTELHSRWSDGLLTVDVMARGASNLKALYFSLSLPGNRLELVSAEPSPGFVSGGQVLKLVLADSEAGTGAIYYGAVLANYRQQPGFSGDGLLARLILKVQSADTAIPLKVASTPPSSTRSAAWLRYETSVFTWYYGNQGDYNQNGVVGLSDLTPLGMYYGETGPFDWKLDKWCIDGDGNGVLNLGDITPLGVNFGRRLSGYRLYHAGSASDYPASNTAPNGAGATLVTETTLSSALGSAIERKYFMCSVPALTPTDYYWVRPFDATGEGTPSNLYNTASTSSWHVYEVAGGNLPSDLAEFYVALANINGHPAIAYSGGEAYYIRATDALGTTWGSRVPVPSDGSHTGWYINLAEINGTPGIAYYSDNSNVSSYVAAIDPDGTNWGTRVPVADFGYTLCLAQVNSRPAIAYFTFTAMGVRVYFERAGDAAGTDWGAPAQDLSGSDQDLSNVALAVIDGRPAVSYRVNRANFSICYKCANDVSGLTWGAERTVYSSPDLGRLEDHCLREVNGCPAVAFIHETPSGHRPAYARASDANGINWDAPAPEFMAAPSYVVGSWMDLAVVGNTPYCAMANGVTLGLDCVTADDVSGTTWQAPQVVDSGSGNTVGDCCSMADINGYPAVAYLDPMRKVLKYAVLF